MHLRQLYDATVESIEMKQRKYGEIEALTKGKSTREIILMVCPISLTYTSRTVCTIICKDRSNEIYTKYRKEIHTSYLNFSAKKMPAMIKCDKESHIVGWKHRYNDFAKGNFFRRDGRAKLCFPV